MKLSFRTGYMCLLYVGCFLLLMSAAVPSYAQVHSDSSSYVRLREGWQVRTGDSPFDGKGVPLWTYEDGSSPDWKPIRLERGTLRGQGNFLWARIKLPAGSWRDPVIFVGNVHRAMEVYFEGYLIYKTGVMRPSFTSKYSIFRWHLFPLEQPFAGEYLYFRVYSDHPKYLGLEGILLGSHAKLVKELLIETETDRLALGFLFALVGLLSFFISLIRKHTQKASATFAFGVLTLSAGMFLISGTSIRQLFWDAPVFWGQISVISLLLFPVGIFAFAEQIMGSGPKLIVRRMWQVHLGYALVAWPLDILDILPFYTHIFPFAALFILNTSIAFTISIGPILKGNTEARIYGFGYLVFALTGIYDLLAPLGLRSNPLVLFHWGLLVAVICLAYVLERRFARAHEQLQTYSQELEVKSAELEESNKKLELYTSTLEQKVEERTQDLRKKNVELEDTMHRLRATQEQLVMSEKMAALGNLVAGVAHEVNNPIGAMHSASDVLHRGLGRIDRIFQSSTTLDDIKNNPQFEKILTLLKDNSQVIGTGSQRVADIVRSLRNFARLDEAEFQSVDIHEGIDSTLTLMQHELRNKAEVVKQYGDIPPITCYPNQLNQVFMNLFMNAARAIEDKGVIQIKTWADDTNVYVEISDSGKGIPPEQINRIFDPGFTTKPGGVGTALGLPISYNIIQKHKGSISVESKVGQGTTFTIALPIEPSRKENN